MRQVLPHPILSLMLVLIWLLLNNAVGFGSGGGFGLGNLLLGTLLGWLIPLFTARFWEAELRIRRPLTLLRFFVTVLYDILVANLAVAALVVGPARNIRPGFVLMPLRLRGRVTVSLLANTISLTPGTLSAFLSADGRTLVIHGLQVDDADAIIATIRTRYEQPLLDSLEAPLKDAQERAGDPDASTAPASSGNGHTPARESE